MMRGMDDHDAKGDPVEVQAILDAVGNVNKLGDSLRAKGYRVELEIYEVGTIGDELGERLKAQVLKFVGRR
jgi:hypothetical protein